MEAERSSRGNFKTPEIPKPVTSAVLNGILFTAYYKLSPKFSKLSEGVLKTQMIAFIASSTIQAGIHAYDRDENSRISKLLGMVVPFVISSYVAPCMHTPAKINLLVASFGIGGSQLLMNEATNYIYSSSPQADE